ncbi:hypothetical protein PoB_004991300 [Plakobranchus ocellatus]|uniref:Uncharacterized protein n=1 Tax=Plakobranchus ocellatus TaxID=259542 RepID=A0AAV4BUZ9_9GAST|nr:hypothetical protein PoB_004991300 [Plakobranchus ocellatus]
MHTVIRWRRPSEIVSSRYPSGENPCNHLLGNALCYIVSGSILLVVGVIITSLTFQNLDGPDNENKERYAGPVLIAAGVLVMARGALSRLWPRRRTLSARRRSLLRRYIRELYSRPIFALEDRSSCSLCDLEVSDLYHISSRSRLYTDDPPSYELVTSQEYLYGDNYVHAYTNPANDIEDDIDNFTFRQSSEEDGPIRIVITAAPPDDGPADDTVPPPTYEEYIKSENMKTTTL